MSCCLRSLFSSLERVRTTDGFNRTDGYNEYMVELSSALSVLFTTLKGYYQHPKATISAFGNVQYQGEISSPLGEILSVLQKVLITLEEKMDDKPPNVLLMIFLCGTDDIPFTVLMVSLTFVYYK